MRRLLSLVLCLTPSLGVMAAHPIATPEIKATPGFTVTRVYAVPRTAQGSWVSLAADDRGRLYASDQYGPIYRISWEQPPPALPAVTKLDLPIGGAHGLSWIDGSLYAVVGQKAVAPTGLYRIRDTDHDGELDHVELLKALDGDGEHGPHAVVAGPEPDSLYVIAGNATRLPELTRSRVPRLWREDSLLPPLPALMGSETRGALPGGWICRTDRAGRSWELMCAGFRNAYALAFNRRGELFTFDSDTEFEINLPWYRPTRVLHAVSGADFGWRGGALKIPDTAPDAWPVVLPMGLGSPTAVLFAGAGKLPPTLADAIWVADWSYGKIFALRLREQPHSGTYQATREEIVSGLPLPVTAMCVNPGDRAIYFTTGGRRQQSALYRLQWTGNVEAAVTPPQPAPGIGVRRELDSFHGVHDARAIAIAWPYLGSDDASLRQSARTALESQPVDAWRERACREPAPRAALTSLLALARADANASQAQILAALERLHAAGLDAGLRPEWLRVLSLTFSRGGAVSAAVRETWAARLSPLVSPKRPDTAPAVIELLVYCEAPDAAVLGMAALRAAPTREGQLEIAKSLRVLRVGWTPELRRAFFDWLGATSAWRGGGTYGRFLQKLRDDALAAVPEGERAPYRALLAAAAKKAAAPDYASTVERKIVREWTVDDLVALAQNDPQKRDPARGRQRFGEAGCFGCHTFANEGGALGPELTAASARLSLRELLEAMVEPSREISDQYGTVLVRVRDGRQLSGRIVNLTENGLHLAENLADPANVVRLAESEIVAIEPSKVSLMPAGLLNHFSGDEILDLLAFLRGGARESDASH